MKSLKLSVPDRYKNDMKVAQAQREAMSALVKKLERERKR